MTRYTSPGPARARRAGARPFRLGLGELVQLAVAVLGVVGWALLTSRSVSPSEIGGYQPTRHHSATTIYYR